jgi:hypothetical protein
MQQFIDAPIQHGQTNVNFIGQNTNVIQISQQGSLSFSVFAQYSVMQYGDSI